MAYVRTRIGEYEERGPYADRPTKELVRKLLDNGQVLIREEIRLAKAEVRADLKEAARGASAVGIGGAVLYGGFLFLAGTVMFLLNLVMPLWVAALLVGAVLAIGGGIAVLTGVRMLKRIEPREAIRSLEEDRRWARDTMRSARSKAHARA